MLASAARAIGGFDVRLGAGTPAWGGEDIDLYLRMLQAGGALVYEPSALICHDHPDRPERLRSEAFHYGIGLTAMLAKHAVLGAERRDMLRRFGGGIRHILDPASRKNAGKQSGGYPRGLDVLERAGMLPGLRPTFAAGWWEAAQHLQVILERQIRVEAVDDVDLGEGLVRPRRSLPQACSSDIVYKIRIAGLQPRKRTERQLATHTLVASSLMLKFSTCVRRGASRAPGSRARRARAVGAPGQPHSLLEVRRRRRPAFPAMSARPAASTRGVRRGSRYATP